MHKRNSKRFFTKVFARYIILQPKGSEKAREGDQPEEDGGVL